ncbi:GNAT domain [Macleaya cordata]|uniref:GNAT domain n=1 Tax=Macleaya cordata TaxID=56857 RepID=A0A200PLQ1_MACCD|nr:GNAT domain [Macleaya cordata]
MASNDDDNDEVIKIRVYQRKIDKIRVEDLERRCKVGQAESGFLFMDTMGDPMCRIRNSPLYKMLVAEFNNELVGVIQGTIKIATFFSNLKDQAVIGYILGLRVSPLHRRTGIGSILVQKLEEWFVANHVDFAYMATEKDNEASVKLFTNKLGFIKFRTPAILVNPVSHHSKPILPNVRIVKLRIEQAKFIYRKFMGSTDFFPCDIDEVLKNKLNLGTWIAYHRNESWNEFDSKFVPPNSWAMLSVWNSCEVFKLRVGKAPLSWKMYGKSSRFIDRLFPCLKIRAIPDVFNRFGFYFMYGVHCEGPDSGSLVHALCRFVHNMARKCKDCKVIVTEVGGCDDTLRVHIPHWRLLSCPEDLWCIKALKSEEKNALFESIRTSHPRALFVDPREV